MTQTRTGSLHTTLLIRELEPGVTAKRIMKRKVHKLDLLSVTQPPMKWYVKCYPGSSKYAIQDTSYKKYIAVVMDGDNPYGVEEEDASALELEHQFQDFYLIKLAGTRRYLEHPNIKLEKNHTMRHISIMKGKLHKQSPTSRLFLAIRKDQWRYRQCSQTKAQAF
ncbi:unnamed protein product [Rhizoctonia solani]|uniref:Uncharacterized protein n=1 Tax=Rhizoctonia solani TaxID=456999 RepID=A0A8H3B5Y2_9AGAM|nr:unnamed protein product [Rhizoctonia solani]